MMKATTRCHICGKIPSSYTRVTLPAMQYTTLHYREAGAGEEGRSICIGNSVPLTQLELFPGVALLDMPETRGPYGPPSIGMTGAMEKRPM